MIPKVHIFWDNSNIFIGAQEVCAPGYRDLSLRLDFSNIVKLSLAGRPFGRGYCVGSIPPETWRVWDQLARRTGIEPELFERGEGTGREQAIDQALQVHMLRAAVDEISPQVAVLLTGDGRGFQDGVGFHADLKRLYDRGWAIEVISWEDCCANALKAWAREVGCFIALDAFKSSLVFHQGVDRVQPLDMRKRPLARPRKV